ncbi:uncharacterized protein LOC111054154 isoform X2 [Nilaparvata lugens]|uniref:uncharacterized protein LOC111054154 isoform X2 n=1 Tax=Nilaparvata lugens TaxID=108931 RepID=UPI00193CB3C5|nr:uncharacterized protein LOC111054154 isoform X2 [Nilaparvata lugens]
MRMIPTLTFAVLLVLSISDLIRCAEGAAAEGVISAAPAVTNGIADSAKNTAVTGGSIWTRFFQAIANFYRKLLDWKNIKCFSGNKYNINPKSNVVSGTPNAGSINVVGIEGDAKFS